MSMLLFILASKGKKSVTVFIIYCNTEQDIVGATIEYSPVNLPMIVLN